jgi:hypothetical protein
MFILPVSSHNFVSRDFSSYISNALPMLDESWHVYCQVYRVTIEVIWIGSQIKLTQLQVKLDSSWL